MHIHDNDVSKLEDRMAKAAIFLAEAITAGHVETMFHRHKTLDALWSVHHHVNHQS